MTQRGVRQNEERGTSVVTRPISGDLSGADCIINEHRNAQPGVK